MCRNPSTHIALEITVSWSRLSGPATQQQLCSLERDKMKLRPSDPFNTVRYLGPKPIKQRKTQPCVAQQRRSAELGHVVVGTSTAVHAMYAYGGEEFYLLRSRRPLGRVLTQGSVRFGTATLGPSICFKLHCCFALRIAGFNFTWLALP